jgi:thioredoxin 1
MTIEVNDSNFEEVVIKSDKPVIVDFWAEWCGPCRMIGPIVEELSEDYKDQVICTKLDVDSNPGVASQVGAVPKSNLEGKLKPLL